MPLSPPVVIRPLSAADRDALGAAFQRLGAESRYRRFLTAMPTLTAMQLRSLTDVDQRDHVALAAVDATDGIVGVARAIRLDGPEAEVAITVVDGYQGRGLGTALLCALAERSREQGVTRYRATVLADNEPVLRLLRGLGETRATPAGPALDVTVDLPEAV